ncbi:MAG: hypothetical protein IJS46_03475 [Kiritimatiellae bacterium]|nr:hypothetical protein [Kiritimatiellia bacterium]
MKRCGSPHLLATAASAVAIATAAPAFAAAVRAVPPAAVFMRRGTAPTAAVKSGAAEWPFSDIAPPGALTPSFAMTSNRGDFSMATGSAPGEAPHVAAILRAAMAAAGWTPAAPSEGFDGGSFWTRGTVVALVGAMPAADGDGSVWIVARLRQTGL